MCFVLKREMLSLVQPYFLKRKTLRFKIMIIFKQILIRNET